jgi:hypothetical protein
MRSASAALAALGPLLTACAAATPPVAVPAPCREPTSADGNGIPLGAGLIGVEITSVAGPPATWNDAGDPALAKVPLAGAVLKSVSFAHPVLGRGASTQASVTFVAPHRPNLYLEARSPVQDEGWHKLLMDDPNIEYITQATAARPRTTISAAGWDHVTFAVSCPDDGERKLAEWTFAVRDREGRRSNTIRASLECTGGAVPGAPPRLDSVALESPEVPAGGRAQLVAHFSGSHPPLQLLATTPAKEYWDFRGAASAEGAAEQRFAIACRADRPAESVLWRFSVRDTFGRESNVIEKHIRCGGCRSALDRGARRQARCVLGRGTCCQRC